MANFLACWSLSFFCIFRMVILFPVMLSGFHGLIDLHEVLSTLSGTEHDPSSG